MLSVVGRIESSADKSEKTKDDKTGEGILSCLQWHKKSRSAKLTNKLPTFLRGSAEIQVGQPVLIEHYDTAKDTVVFAYDPEQTPAPEIALRNGITKGEKLLFMDGELVVHFANAGSLEIADINIIESTLLA